MGRVDAASADWLTVHHRTLFRLRPDGRIERENDPDASPGPRFWLAGDACGNHVHLRADLTADIAARLEALALDEPPLAYPAIPRHTERYQESLGVPGPVEPRRLGLIYEMPNGLADSNGLQLIGSDGEDGQKLAQDLWAKGMPDGLSELGFATPADFWPPWCGALRDGEIVSIAFAARLSEAGAALGIATAKSHRRRGYAAAAVAGWTRLPSLRTRILFYSTDRANVASQGVAGRLGLRLRATSLRIP